MYLRHIVHQRHALVALAGAAWHASSGPLSRLQERGADLTTDSSPPTLPRPELTARVPAPPSSLVRDYLVHVGADPATYRGVVPPHLFLQWSLPLAARTLRGLPYPLLRI